MNKNELLLTANSPTTAPKKLTEIYDEYKWYQEQNQNHDPEIIEAVANNPNTSNETLKKIFQYEPGMADVVFNNSITSLLLLEYPELIKNWVEEASRIYKTNESEQLQQIGFDTGNEGVLRSLASSIHTPKYMLNEIIDTAIATQNGSIMIDIAARDDIPKKDINTLSEYFINKSLRGESLDYSESLAVNMIIRNQHSDEFAMHIMSNKNQYQIETQVLIYERARNSPDLAEKLEDADNTIYKNVNAQVKSFIPDVKRMIEMERLNDDLTFPHTDYFVNCLTIYDSNDITGVSSRNGVSFIYDKNSNEVLTADVSEEFLFDIKNATIKSDAIEENFKWASSIAPYAEQIFNSYKNAGRTIINGDAEVAIGKKYQIHVDSKKDEMDIRTNPGGESRAKIERSSRRVVFAKPRLVDKENWQQIVNKTNSLQNTPVVKARIGIEL